ncbi:MAG: alpha-galactosidase, partial [Saprospiraceae bacterium]
MFQKTNVIKTGFLTAMILFCFCVINAQSQSANSEMDWLIQPIKTKATIVLSGKNIILNNGLINRTLRMSPNAACFDYSNLSNGQQLIRSVKPEAKIFLDGIEYNIGGLQGQTENA